jgi:hypothetical protein
MGFCGLSECLRVSQLGILDIACGFRSQFALDSKGFPWGMFGAFMFPMYVCLYCTYELAALATIRSRIDRISRRTGWGAERGLEFSLTGENHRVHRILIACPVQCGDTRGFSLSTLAPSTLGFLLASFTRRTQCEAFIGW